MTCKPSVRHPYTKGEILCIVKNWRKTDTGAFFVFEKGILEVSFASSDTLRLRFAEKRKFLDEESYVVENPPSYKHFILMDRRKAVSLITEWREYIKPHVKKMVDLCNGYRVIPFFHGCGGFSELWPDFIEMGIKAVSKLQTEAKGNNFKRLKKEFGDKICLWGGIDAQHIVPLGTPEEVRKHVEEIIDIGSVGSGFIVDSTHTHTADTPIENIITVYNTLKEKCLK